MNQLHMPIGEYYTAEWYEYNGKDTLEDEDSYEAFSEEFHYASFIDEHGIRFPMPGMRTSAGLDITIETRSDLPFKELDKVKFHNGSILKIKSVEVVRDTSNDLASFQFNGAVDEYSTVVIRFSNG